jgi:hypothetical protein
MGVPLYHPFIDGFSIINHPANLGHLPILGNLNFGIFDMFDISATGR